MANATVGATRPVRTCLLFARALSLGELEPAAACFTRDGCLITPDATAIHGRDRIRPLLAQLVARGIEIEVELSSAVGGGDLVLAQERWKVRSGGTDGLRIEQTWNPTLVLRRIEEDWRLAIAAPWGWGQMRL